MLSPPNPNYSTTTVSPAPRFDAYDWYISRYFRSLGHRSCSLRMRRGSPVAQLLQSLLVILYILHAGILILASQSARCASIWLHALIDIISINRFS